MKRWKTNVVKKSVGMITVLALSLSLSIPASAKQSVPHSKVFDLDAPVHELFRDKALHNGTVQQSFGFDDVNGHVYVMQLMAGGIQLPGEDAPVSGATRSLNGDLTLTKLDLEGNKLGYMYLKGFGHGVQMGIETEDGVPYIWSETDSVAEGKEGWGTQLARFPFEDGAILTPDSASLEKHRLVEGADRTTVNIDSSNNLLTMRYRVNGVFHFGVFSLDDVKEGRYVPAADVVQPSLGTFQGFASYGSFLYLLEGNAYGSNGSVAPTGNTYITVVNLENGEVVDRELFTGGQDLSFREPEGLGIRVPDIRHPHKAQLYVGFASNFTPNRLSNLLYIDELMPLSRVVK
ncbi:MAG: Tat pathway signal sequence domain protein [Bacillota bacterium]